MTRRTTVAEIQQLIVSVQAAAANAGFTRIGYSEGTYSEIWLRQENGTCWLSTRLPDSGAVDIGTARGVHDVAVFLRGMYAGLDSARHNGVTV